MKIKTPPLTFEFNEKTAQIAFENAEITPNTRLLLQMREVIEDQNFASQESNQNKQLYFMYRALQRKQDSDLFEKHAIRFDVTIIPPLLLGKECNKTAGHYHPSSPSQGKSYPEVYQVLKGKAHYLLQKRGENDAEIIDAILIKAKKGDTVLIPPNYGHATINPSKKNWLVMANLVASHFESNYGPYKTLNGAAFFEHANNKTTKNPYYQKTARLKKIEARKFKPTFQAGLSNKSIYQQFLEKPEKFGFLNAP